MAPQLVWDAVGERIYETGVDRGVLYTQDNSGSYTQGYAWNGLTSVTESPSGAEPNKIYADNLVYLNLISLEEFACTLEAYTYPDAFGICDGSALITEGVQIGQQTRRAFGLSYRTLVGNDLQGNDFGYKIHLIWNGLAAPSEKAYSTVNDSPEPIAFSWEISTTPVAVGQNYRPTATMSIDSTKVDAAKLAELEAILYGTETTPARLPLPAEIIELFADTPSGIEVTPATPTQSGNEIQIPTVTGVVYQVDDVTVTGVVNIDEDTIVVAVPASGYRFPESATTEWVFEFTP